MPRLLFGLACCAALALPNSASAVEMTDRTKQLLEEMGLSEDILEGLDEELAIPQEWIDKAKQEEGKLQVRGVGDELEFQPAKELFEARYPYIEIEWTPGTSAQGSTQPRLSYIQGNIVMDVAYTIGREHALWAEIDGFEDISDLPALFTQVEGGVSEDNLTVAMGTNSYCISYNTDQFSKEDMPATWEELPDTEAFGDGKLGLSVNMTVWLPYLVSENGWEWGLEYMDRLFALKPQRRREGFNMISKLTGLGEFGVSIPQADKQVARSRADDIPVAWHCPTPVPLSFTEAAIIKGNPRPYQSKIFINWLISKEAQLSDYNMRAQRPAHKDLFDDFTAYPEETAGKPRIPHTLAISELTKKLIEPWGEHFEAE